MIAWPIDNRTPLRRVLSVALAPLVFVALAAVIIGMSVRLFGKLCVAVLAGFVLIPISPLEWIVRGKSTAWETTRALDKWVEQL